MMYELSKSTMYAGELMEEQMKQTNNTGLLQVAEQESFDFEKDILAPLLASAGSEKEFRTALDDYINFYNDDRPHAHNKYRTPTQAERDYYSEHAD